ncbi:MAG: hypothetical protein ACR2OV_06815 [Hyphomicrobiaceae bacterium]
MRGNRPGGINPARIIILLANTATTTPPHTAMNKRRKPAKALGGRQWTGPHQPGPQQIGFRARTLPVSGP